MPDHLASLGSLGFTYRTRRLADRLADGGRRFYDPLDLSVEPSWHTLLLYLERHGPVSVTAGCISAQGQPPGGHRDGPAYGG